MHQWQKGQTGAGVKDCGVDARKTTPPEPYTEGTLLTDMKGASRFIADPRLREALKEADGIGTPATRASIIERIKEVGFVSVVKGKIRSTDKGKGAVKSLPTMVTDPGTTAVWEQMLGMIARGEMMADEFSRRVEGSVRKLVSDASTQTISLGEKAAGESCACAEAGCKGGGMLRKVKGKKGAFWACSRHPDCTNRFDEKNGRPVLRVEVVPLPGDGGSCPACGKGKLITRSVTKEGSKAYGKRFLSCGNYPSCKHTEWES